MHLYIYIWGSLCKCWLSGNTQPPLQPGTKPRQLSSSQQPFDVSAYLSISVSDAFETRPHYVAQLGLEFLILLALQPFTHWDYMCALSTGSFTRGMMYFLVTIEHMAAPLLPDSAGHPVYLWRKPAGIIRIYGLVFRQCRLRPTETSSTPC